MPLKFGFKSRLFTRSCVDLSTTRARGVDSESDLVITVGFRGSQVALGHCSNDGKDDHKHSKNKVTSKKKDKGTHPKNRNGTSVDPKPPNDHKFTGHATSYGGARRKPRVRSTGQLPMLQECTYTSNGHANVEQESNPPEQVQTPQAVTSSEHTKLDQEVIPTGQGQTPRGPKSNSHVKLHQSKSTECDKKTQIMTNSNSHGKLQQSKSTECDKKTQITESNGHVQSPREPLSLNEVCLLPADTVVATPSSNAFTPETSKTNALNVANSGAKRHTACLSASRVVNAINSESSKASRRKSSGPLTSLSTGVGGGLIRRRSKGKPDVVHWKRKVCFVILLLLKQEFS